MCAETLKLNIVHTSYLLDHYDRWMNLPFHKVHKLVINGLQHINGQQGLPLRGVDGLRLYTLLAKLGRTVKTLVLRATFSDENDEPCDDIMSTIVSSCEKLEALDIPWPEVGPSLARHPLAHKPLYGLSKDINNFPQAILEHLPHLQKLHINIHDWSSEATIEPPDMRPARVVYDCSRFFSFMKDNCPRIDFLHIDFAGWAVLRKEAFECLPGTIQCLVLGLKDVLIQGASAEIFNAETAYRHLHPWIPPSCRLYVLSDCYQIGLIDLEKSMQINSDPGCRMEAIAAEQ